MDLYLLCSLPGRHPDGLPAGDGRRDFAVGVQRWPVAPAGIFRLLAFLWDTDGHLSHSLEKIFGIYKNFVCIWGKMGYNKVYENFQFTEKAEEEIPWQKNKPRRKP